MRARRTSVIQTRVVSRPGSFDSVAALCTASDPIGNAKPGSQVSPCRRGDPYLQRSGGPARLSKNAHATAVPDVGSHVLSFVSKRAAIRRSNGERWIENGGEPGRPQDPPRSVRRHRNSAVGGLTPENQRRHIDACTGCSLPCPVRRYDGQFESRRSRRFDVGIVRSTRGHGDHDRGDGTGSERAVGHSRLGGWVVLGRAAQLVTRHCNRPVDGEVPSPRRCRSRLT
jgi:hypothetical protein